ncbi:hypothetical protein [Mucilaginibacter sp. KACC 22063]|uniref:hypothetical protein n=1 Tax=Mucilaginibacter sp. KACC 22063 TaxID=3025666 RepID=UPI002365B27F|nr:hypothetical protein [Mucilaginibacter sp. KACC 22063]WDF54469.1 hypothetical protein PQ461_16115 [Mucilaginibacter sp. KACC 22063]
MKKFSLLLFLFSSAFIAQNVKAQSFLNAYRENTWHFGIGADAAGVINPGSTLSRFGLGGQLHLLYYPTPNVGVSVSTGFFTIPGKDKNKNYSVVPFTIGAKAFVSQDIYLSTEVGAGYLTPKTGSNMTKIVAPGIGYNDNDTGLDISLRYQVNHQRDTYVSMIALHLAYYFNLSRGY